MAADSEKSALERIAEVLAAHDVEFIVVGGQAEALLGSPRVTYEIDLCYRRTEQNLERLADALGELEIGLRGAPEDLIAIKEHIGRPRDRDSLLQLRAIQKIRDEGE